MSTQPPDRPFTAVDDDDDVEEMQPPPEVEAGRLLLNVRQEVTWAQFMEIARVLKGETPTARHDGWDDDNAGNA